MITTRTPAHLRSEQQTKGFTLTEIAIVLGIIGLILGAIWTAAASVYNNQRTAHANTAILQLTQGVRTLFSTAATTGVTADTDMTLSMIQAGVFPADLVKSDKSGTIDPWAGGSTLVISPADGLSFTIEMNNLPPAACISLLTNVAGNSRDQGLGAVGATAASGTVGSTASSGVPLPTGSGQVAAVKATDAAAACSSPNANIVQFGFSLK